MTNVSIFRMGVFPMSINSCARRVFIGNLLPNYLPKHFHGRVTGRERRQVAAHMHILRYARILLKNATADLEVLNLTQ